MKKNIHSITLLNSKEYSAMDFITTFMGIVADLKKFFMMGGSSDGNIASFTSRTTGGIVYHGEFVIYPDNIILNIEKEDLDEDQISAVTSEIKQLVGLVLG